jgi:ribosomal protein S12 methylthiotransferase
VLLEEPIQGEELIIGRIYAQAPEVDGLTVVRSGGLEPGRFIRCRIEKVNGVDLEAVPE